MRCIEIETPSQCIYRKPMGDLIVCCNPIKEIRGGYVYTCSSKEQFDSSCPLKIVKDSETVNTAPDPATYTSLRRATKLAVSKTGEKHILMKDVTSYLISNGYLKILNSGNCVPTQKGLDSLYFAKFGASGFRVTGSGLDFIVRRIKAGDIRHA